MMPPVVNISTPPTPGKISHIFGKNYSWIGITSDIDAQRYQIRRVASASDPVTAGDLVEQGWVPNDDFEANLTGWTRAAATNQALPTISRVNTWASLGAWSMRMQTGNLTIANRYVQILSDFIGVPNGYTLKAMVDLNVAAISGTTSTVQVALAGYNSNKVFVSQAIAIYSGSGVKLNSQSAAYVVPATVSYVRVGVYFNVGGTPSGSADIYIDNARLVWPANNENAVQILDTEVATATEGDNLLKAFMQSAADGSWST